MSRQTKTQFGFIVLCLVVFSPVASAQTGDPEQAKACVIVLHGMGRTSNSMGDIAGVLQADGYRVWNEGYPSLSENIEFLSQASIDSALKYCREAAIPPQGIHFVTHSLGGILLRHYLQTQSIAELDKVVMLSPPNHGSEIVDTYRDNWLFRAVMGPAFLQLGTDGVVTQLRAIPGTIGIITGNETSDPWFSDTIPGPDDGKVSVESAKLAEMADFLVVPAGHTFIMDNPTVIQQVQYFLRHGHFQHPDPDPGDQSGHR